MYYLIGRAFQNQSIILRAFPRAFASSAVCANNNNNNNFGGFVVGANAGSRNYHKWTRPDVNQLVSKSGGLSSVVTKRMSSSGDHVTLWTAERVLSGVLVPLLPVTFLMPSAPLEYMVAFCLTLHSHWGIEAIVVDYVRPSVFGAVIPKLALAAVYGLSAMTLGGLCYFIYSDVGIVSAIKMLWKL